MNWIRIEAVFEVVFSTQSLATFAMCVQELRALGLADNQIENGLMAGSLQMAFDFGVYGSLKEVFEAFARQHPADADIVMRSVLPQEIAA